MPKTVKLADIAEVVGVSIVTVSKALSGKNGVSEELREKIKKVADELGYRPLSSARPGRAGMTGNVGVLIPERFLDQTSFYWELYQKIVGSLTGRGWYAILEILRLDTEKGNELPMMIQDQKVDGVIAMGQSVDAYAEFLQENTTVPLVFLDFYNGGKVYDSVISDSYYGSYILTNYVISMGHKEIGFVGTVLSTSSITDRYFGYCKAMKEHGLTVHEEWIVPDRMTGIQLMTAEEEFEMPLKLPTAFVCNCDITAYMVIRKLEERGIRVPEDISIVGYDNFSYSDPSNLPLTTYDVGMHKMAETSVDTVIKKIKGETYYKGVQIVTGHMVIRDSVRQLNEELSTF